MKKRQMLSLAAGGLMAAMLPGVAAAQTIEAQEPTSFAAQVPDYVFDGRLAGDLTPGLEYVWDGRLASNLTREYVWDRRLADDLTPELALTN